MHWCSWKDYLLICFRLLFAIRTQVNVHLSLNLTVIRILIIRQLLANICQEYNGTLLPKGLCSDLFLMVAYVDYVVTLSVSSLITDYAVMYRCWSNCNRRFWCWTHHHYSYYNSHDRYSISYCHNRLCSVSMVNTVFSFFYICAEENNWQKEATRKLLHLINSVYSQLVVPVFFKKRWTTWFFMSVEILSAVAQL